MKKCIALKKVNINMIDKARMHPMPHSESEVNSLSRVRLFGTPWTVAHQATPSMGISRQQYWSGLPFPSPGDLPNPGIDPGSPALWADFIL